MEEWTILCHRTDIERGHFQNSWAKQKDSCVTLLVVWIRSRTKTGTVSPPNMSGQPEVDPSHTQCIFWCLSAVCSFSMVTGSSEALTKSCFVSKAHFNEICHVNLLSSLFLTSTHKEPSSFVALMAQIYQTYVRPCCILLGASIPAKLANHWKFITFSSDQFGSTVCWRMCQHCVGLPLL